MTLKRALIGLLVAAVLLAGGVFTYSRYFAPPEDTTNAEFAATTAVPVDRIAIANAAGSVSAEGRIVPLRHATLAFAGSGVVAEIVAAPGEAVAAGQPILRLDAADQQAAQRAAEAAQARALAARDAAEVGVEAAQLGITAAGLGVRAAEAELALASAAPRPEEIALAESNVALAEARITGATAAQAQLLEGAGAARIRAAEDDQRAAEPAAIPPRLRI